MTTDPTALQERIAEELYYDQHPEGRHRSEWPTAVYPDDVYEYRDLAAAVLPIIARVRRDAQREAYTTARSVLAGEDTVEWARGAHSSSMSYPHAIGIMDDLIEDLDEEVSP